MAVSTPILSAQPFLSGISAEQLAIARELAARKFNPLEHAQLVATEAVLDRVKSARQC